MTTNEVQYDSTNEASGEPSLRTDALPTNRTMVARSEQAWRDLLAAAQVRTFHGTVSVEVAVQAGTIQHVRRHFERVEKNR